MLARRHTRTRSEQAIGELLAVIGEDVFNFDGASLMQRLQEFARTSSDLLLGVGYGIAKGGTVNLTFKSNVSGSNGADLRLNWLHTF